MGKYENAKTKVKIRHDKCGHIYYTTPDTVVNKGCRCPSCYGNHNKDHKKFIEDLTNKHKNNYTILEKYQKANTKLKVRHNSCGYVWEATPDNIMSLNSCPKCAGNIHRTLKDFKNEVKREVGEEYLVLGEYINADTPILMKHNIEECGYEWEPTPSVFSRGCRCPSCAGNLKKSQKDFEKDVKKVAGDEYVVIGDYVNTNTKIDILHKKCDTIFSPRPYSFLGGTRCPYCSNSKIEKAFKEFLKKIGLKKGEDFKYDKGIKGCRHKKKLRFDFQILYKDNNYAIELDGEYHYRPKRGIELLKKQKKRDEKKNVFCVKENIQLVRIPYWEFDTIKRLINDNNQEFINAILNGRLKTYLKKEWNIHFEYPLIVK